MRRFFEIACIFILTTSIAKAGSVGGGSSGIVAVVYDSINHILYVPGNLNQRFDISRSGFTSDSGYYMDANDFARLLQAVDSYKNIDAKGEAGGTRSYRVVSGDQAEQVELIDRRAAARSGVAP